MPKEDNKVKILTVGVFDFFHLGHLRLFENCKKINGANYLIVAVQDGDCILKRKPNAKIMYSTEERIELIKALRCVDEVIVYKNIEDDIINIDFDIFATGPDQNHDGFKKAIEWCRINKRKTVIIPRTKGICSSKIKKNIYMTTK